MINRRRRSRLLLGGVAAVAAAVGLWAGVAYAAETIKADPNCCTFTEPEYFSDVSEVPVFDNAGADSPHNVTAFQKGPDGKPLFRSANIAKDHTGIVNGTQYLPAGTYDFFCTIHGPTMKSKLTIQQKSSPPVARPKIDVAIPAQSLSKVRSSGKLKVKVSAKTLSDRISVVAKKGARKLGSAAGIDLAQGASRNVTLALTAAGKRSLKNLKSAKVTATGSVPFGKSDSASRTLR
ncbi:MAG: hypothetical protein U0R52_02995 [Solirubrobacterales bacterium]